ncbi:hypothetical protein CQA89_27110 [Klebsiella pneumoniae]|nr:hypothetical protein CQA89_27110 [Klebsiella pneumoniae]
MKDHTIPLTLISILADGEFHSGEQLGEQLGMSRAAINKHIQTLRDWGVDVFTVPGKGYSLPEPIHLLDEKKISQEIDHGRVTVLPVIDSTNQYLLDRLDELTSGDACVAEYQQAGRGRRGRKWFSPFGANLYLSMYWRLEQGPAAAIGLSLVIGIVIAEVLQQLGAEQVRVKWPNDIYLQDRKLSGILVELTGKTGDAAQIVSGAGINLVMRRVESDVVNQGWISLQVFARVTLNDSGEISLQGGEGIGTVTRKGIGLPTGSPAINRTPRHTIETAVREAIGPTRGAQVEIFAPEGVLRAQKTYNARLGILGGISIIGTTGIVTPMSEESWKRSLSLELEIKRAAGLERVVLVPGNHGERFVREQMGIDPQMVVTMSNFVGYMIEEAVRLGFRQIVLIGHPGKLIKIAAGIFHTHSHIADARMETLVAHLALLGAPLPLLTLVSECDTTEAAMEHIDAWGYQRLYNHLAERICQRVLEMLRFTQQPPTCDAVLFSFDNQVLGSSRPLAAIARELTC